MNSRKLVSETIKGINNSGITPVYMWVYLNMGDKIEKEFGSVENFEDKYKFDLAHIFGGPQICDTDLLDSYRNQDIEITPELFLDIPLSDVDNMEKYDDIKKALKHHGQERDRFCYVQTNGIFECLNGVFGIENHLMYLMLYPDELKQIYKRQSLWNKKFAENVIELGVDMVHVSDDWGAQNSLIFSPAILRNMIMPYHKPVCEYVKSKNVFLSLHNDGNVIDALPVIEELGYDLLHPWQESAGMSYDHYLGKYADKFSLMGGICIQTSLGFNNYVKLKNDINRVFGLLKGKRWICCTTHFVQAPCSLDELIFACDLINKLAGK